MADQIDGVIIAHGAHVDRGLGPFFDSACTTCIGCQQIHQRKVSKVIKKVQEEMLNCRSVVGRGARQLPDKPPR